MMHWGPGWGWGWGLIGFGGLVFWGLVIWILVVALRSGSPARPSAPGWGRSEATDDPERILAARYARGEIDEQEYHRRLEVIRGSRDRH